jgi:hypothetical protein
VELEAVQHVPQAPVKAVPARVVEAEDRDHRLQVLRGDGGPDEDVAVAVIAPVEEAAKDGVVVSLRELWLVMEGQQP